MVVPATAGNGGRDREGLTIAPCARLPRQHKGVANGGSSSAAAAAARIHTAMDSGASGSGPSESATRKGHSRRFRDADLARAHVDLGGSASQFTRLVTASGVATLPAITKACGNFASMRSIVFCTLSAWPCAIVGPGPAAGHTTPPPVQPSEFQLGARLTRFRT